MFQRYPKLNYLESKSNDLYYNLAYRYVRFQTKTYLTILLKTNKLLKSIISRSMIYKRYPILYSNTIPLNAAYLAVYENNSKLRST